MKRLAIPALVLAVALLAACGDKKAGLTCRDGSTSSSQSRQGACSHHGGIA